MNVGLGLLVFVLVLCGGTLIYMVAARRREKVMVENEGAGYRDAALTEECRHVSWSRLFRELPLRHFKFITVFAAVCGLIVGYWGVIAGVERSAIVDAARSVLPRYETVAMDSRGMVVDSRNQPVGDVLDFGPHFVWSHERIATVYCSPTLTTMTYETYVMTTDHRYVGLRARGLAAFYCADDVVRRIVSERRGVDAWREDAWNSYIVPMVRDAFEALTHGQTAAEISGNRREIVEAIGRRMQQSTTVQVSSPFVELLLSEARDDEERSSAPSLSDFDFPILEGWSTSSADSWFTYSQRQTNSFISIRLLSSARGTPEEMIREIQSESSDRPYTGRIIESSLIRGASGDLFLTRAFRDDGGNVLYDFSTVMESGRPGVNLLIFGLCNETGCEQALDGMSRVIDYIRPVDVD